MLIDLIIGVICKFLAILFTIVNLQIACNNYLFLTLQTMGAPDTRRDIHMFRRIADPGLTALQTPAISDKQYYAGLNCY